MTNQLTMFGEPPEPPKPTPVPTERKLFRRSHPDTSRQAAENLVLSGTHEEHRKIARSLVRLFPGRTGAELDDLAGSSTRQISKRLAELADCEPPVIRRGPSRICEINKSKCKTWWKVDAEEVADG